jgi:hypothetical protein
MLIIWSAIVGKKDGNKKYARSNYVSQEQALKFDQLIKASGGIPTPKKMEIAAGEKMEFDWLPLDKWKTVFDETLKRAKEMPQELREIVEEHMYGVQRTANNPVRFNPATRFNQQKKDRIRRAESTRATST